jgi:hypothetical protein
MFFFCVEKNRKQWLPPRNHADINAIRVIVRGTIVQIFLMNIPKVEVFYPLCGDQGNAPLRFSQLFIMVFPCIEM